MLNQPVQPGNLTITSPNFLRVQVPNFRAAGTVNHSDAVDDVDDDDDDDTAVLVFCYLAPLGVLWQQIAWFGYLLCRPGLKSGLGRVQRK